MKTKTAKDLFAKEQLDWINSARREAIRQLQNKPQITIHDVTANCPLPTFLKKNALSKIFKCDVFRPIGYTRAKTPQSHGHIVRLWTLQEAYFPENYMTHRRRNLEEVGNDY